MVVPLNVLVYSGPGVSSNSQTFLMRTLRQFLSHRYAIIPVDQTMLRTQPWETKAALFVMPGGRDLPYTVELNGDINRRIRQWVQNGGRYLGLCAGGYYGSGRCEFEPGTPIEIIGSRELAFFSGSCIGTAYPGYDYKSETGARAAEVTVDQSAFNVSQKLWKSDPSHVRIYYNGGGYFVPEESDTNVTVLVRYAPDVTNPHNRSQKVADAAAAISCKVGRGVAVLTGLHPEYAWSFLAPSSFVEPHNRQTVSLLRSHDAYRRRLFGAMLGHMKIDIDPDALDDSVDSGNQSRIPVRTPTFIVPARATGVAAVATTMYSLNGAATAKGNVSVAGVSDAILQDTIQDIHIINAATANGERRVPYEYQSTILQPAEIMPMSPSDRDDSVNANSNKDESREDAILVICTHESLPSTKETPRFDMKLAIKYMQEAKAHTMGSWLMYSEVTGSTQTFLEKNLRLQSLLPNGTVNVAAVQVSGRGRGRNVWISPVGCLQFSMLLRHPNLKQAPVVMLQYLFSLAAMEAIKGQPGYGGLPLRLKWPNDVYALYDSSSSSDTSGASSDEAGGPGYVKIGGLLVGSSYKASEFMLLFGFGISVANPLPTTSVNKLIREYNLRHGSALAPMTMEKTLALVTSKFEELYRQFLVHGFEPLLKLYYRNWLHTDQVVTLADKGFEKARVIGLCPNEGLLLVRSLLNPKVVYGLQPDGNSFDMMQGLISTKTN
ncbi:biotin holocarboxylase synthetase [Coemansia interrupta]|uniref:Biotin holocarboxylase synthetase n=1 Tax=Coemansia interrupta TaxID=1126814 RepID=A0A9W8LPA9_9FUNG|nr:biotin holocarboxylase synthetase [Coemansia interrupta]